MNIQLMNNKIFRYFNFTLTPDGIQKMDENQILHESKMTCQKYNLSIWLSDWLSIRLSDDSV